MVSLVLLQYRAPRYPHEELITPADPRNADSIRTTFPRNIRSPEVYKLDLGFSSSSAQLTTLSSRASQSKIMSNVQEPPTAPVEQEAPAVSNTPGATNVAPVFESLDADEVR